MKKIFALALFALPFVSFSQEPPLTFKSTSHDFGKIRANVPVTYNFEFTNTSGKAQVIEVASADCGCTVPEYPKAPISAGKSETIKVTYAANSGLGVFHKNVHVKLANLPKPIDLSITGTLVDK